MLFLVTQQLFTEPVQSDWAQVRLQVSSKPGRENVNYRASPSRTVTLSVSHCSLSSSPSSLFHLCLLTMKPKVVKPQTLIQTLTSDQNPVWPLLTSLTNNTHLLLIFTHRNAEEKEEQEYLEERRRQEDDDKASGDKNGGQTMKR